MKLLALGLTAAIAAGAALSATPASAGIYFGYSDGYQPAGYWHHRDYDDGYYYRPHYRPRPAYYGYGGYGYGYNSGRVCSTRVVTKYGYYGPVTSKVVSCRNGY